MFEDVLKDWKFLSTVFGLVINFLVSLKMMNNHLKHLADDIKDILKRQETQGKEMSEIKNEIAYMKGENQSNKDIINLLNQALNK